MAKRVKRIHLRLLRWIAVVCALGIAAAFLVSWWVGARLVAPTPRAIGAPPADLHAETVSIPSRSGSILGAWYVPGEPGKATIVLLHPIRGSRLSMIDRARLLHRVGYSVLLVDLQAHGESPGQHITAGHLERWDAQAAVDYARSRNPNERVGIVGVSLGGAAALLATPIDVDAMVLESVYPTIDEAIDNRVRMRLGPLAPIASRLLLLQMKLRLDASPKQLRPIDHIEQVRCPVLVMGGDRDRHTTLAETEHLFDSAAEPKQLAIFAGASHQDLQHFAPEEYEEVVVGFLAEYLDADSP